ncbi:LysR family transcriptional regulator [Achromobacter aloeverae]
MPRSLIPTALRYVDQVARSGSIQRAARELNVAASAINRQLLLLEEELGVPLFERMPRGMRLTASGDAIVAMARRWRNDERRAAEDIRKLQGVHQGLVRLVAMGSHVNGFLSTWITDLACQHPNISLSVEICNTDEASAALLDGTADLAAAFNLSPGRHLHVLWEAELPLGCIVAPGHPLASQASVSLQEVCGYAVALQSKSLFIRRYLESHYSWLFGDSQNRIETNSLTLMKKLAQTGRYVSVTSELDAAPELLDGSLRFVPVRDKGAEPQVIRVAIDARKPLSPIVKVTAETLSESIRLCLERVRARPSSGSGQIAAEPQE